jgi:hydroxymethylpyrimidine pyrophosphatase-like HAD family hydrolase
MIPRFIFDMDGTLTDNRSKIEPSFAEVFSHFCQANYTYVVSGAGYNQIKWQLGDEICNSLDGVFSCAGNEHWIQNKLISKNTWTPSPYLIAVLANFLAVSAFPHKNGKHFDFRNGMLNFSISGQQPTVTDRKIYTDWDNYSEERIALVHKVKTNFPEIECVIAGETGVDIYPVGKDKSQILENFYDQELIFFGDSITNYGNDFSIAQYCDVVYEVTDWRETNITLLANYFNVQ